MDRSAVDSARLTRAARNWGSKETHLHDSGQELKTIRENVFDTLDLPGDALSKSVYPIWKSNLDTLGEIVETARKVIQDTQTAFHLMANGFQQIDSVTHDAAKHLAGGTGNGQPGGSPHRS